jgi:hypothetical protein
MISFTDLAVSLRKGAGQMFVSLERKISPLLHVEWEGNKLTKRLLIALKRAYGAGHDR